MRNSFQNNFSRLLSHCLNNFFSPYLTIFINNGKCTVLTVRYKLYMFLQFYLAYPYISLYLYKFIIYNGNETEFVVSISFNHILLYT